MSRGGVTALLALAALALMAGSADAPAAIDTNVPSLNINLDGLSPEDLDEVLVVINAAHAALQENQ